PYPLLHSFPTRRSSDLSGADINVKGTPIWVSSSRRRGEPEAKNSCINVLQTAAATSVTTATLAATKWRKLAQATASTWVTQCFGLKIFSTNKHNIGQCLAI